MAAPDRIWVTGIGKDPTSHWWHSGTIAGATEYIRADLAAPTTMTPEVKALVNGAVLSKAAYEGVSSLLLSVQQDCVKERQRVERLEAAVAILEDALQEAGDDYPGSSMQQWCQHQVKAARAALKGDDHE